MKNIAIFGAGGFGKEVASILQKINELEPTWNLIGFYDDGIDVGTKISIYGNVLGGVDTLNTIKEELHVVFAIGSPKILRLLVGKISNPNIKYPNIIHPDVYFADERTFQMGRGNVIVRACSFSVDVSIGDFNQFNSISALAHDVKVGSYNVFMPLTRISGEAQIGDLNTFGLGTLVLQRIKIGNETRFGPNAVVMTKPKSGHLYMGNPAKKTIL